MPVLLDFGLTTKAYSAFPESTGSFCTGTNIIMSFCLKTIWNRQSNKDMKNGLMVIMVKLGSSLRTFYGHYNDLINRYEISVSQETMHLLL
jgi:hypothetical protein